MKRVKVDNASAGVKRFLRDLPVAPNGVELELSGKVIGKLMPPSDSASSDTAAILVRGRELVKRARQRNQGVSARVLEREVRQAVHEVRTRQRQ